MAREHEPDYDSDMSASRKSPAALLRRLTQNAPDAPELDRALQALLGSSLPDEVVIDLSADREARHGVAVELLQHLRLRGFVNVELVAVGQADLGTAFGGAQ